MPSPDTALPSDGTALTDAQVALSVTAPETAPSVTSDGLAPTSPTSIATGAVTEAVQESEATVAVADGAANEGAAAPAPPRKRRRRRRRKGAHGAEANASAVAAAPEPGSAEKPEPSDGTAPENPEAGPKPNEGATEAQGGERKARKAKAKNKPGGEKRREKREARERPAFGVGDVVFGKILEITDDAIIVDLSGKATGIFDRAEMLLPDDTTEAPPAGEKGSSSSKAPDLVRVEPIVAALSAEVPPSAESPGGADVATSDGDVPPTVESGGVERRHAGRRIIVAAGARETVGEAATPDAHGPEGAAVSTNPATPPLASEVSDGPVASGPRLDDAGATASQLAPKVEEEEEQEVEEKDETPAPKAAPYAPPIILEVGAHFVALVHNDGARGGLVVLTRHPRRVSQAKSMVAAALRENKTVKGLVTGLVKGGVEIDVDGLRAFVPGSHMDLRLGTDLHRFIGQRLEFEVTQYGKRGRDVVLSRKAQLEADAKASRAASLAKLAVGAVVDGVVRSVVAFGAFVDVGGVEGLVSLMEMSHNRADTPSDVFKVGETAKVKILRVDDKGKVWLSRRAVTVDPRIEAFKKYALGTRHVGKVVRLQPFGAFVELEPGIDGLIHTLDLSMKPIEHPSEVVKVGDSLDVVVSQVDLSNQKIALHPAPTGAASDEPPQRIVLHKPLKVVVAAIDPGGLVVRVMGATGRAARGFITAAATGTPRGTELRKPFPIGMQLEAKVVEYDPKRGDLKLSIKALREDGERNAYQQYRQQVNREAKFGTFGDLLAKKGLTTK